MVDFWIHDLAHPTTDIGFDYSITNIGHLDGMVLMDQVSFDRQRHALLGEQKRNPWALKQLLDAAQRHFDTVLFPYFQTLKSVSVADRSALAAILQAFRQQLSQYCTFIILPLYVEEDITIQIREGLKAYGTSDQAAEWFMCATTMVEEGLIASEQRRLCELAALPESALTDTVLNELSERFSWMSNQLYWMDFHSDEYYRDRITALRAENPIDQLAGMDQSLAGRRTAYQDLIKQLGNDEPLRAAVETLQAAIWFRNFRGERLYQSSWYLRPVLQAAARLSNISEKETVWFTIPEIVTALQSDSHLDVSIVDQRRRGFALITNVNHDEVVIGQQLIQLKAAIHLNKENDQEPSGQSAYPGKVTGRVYIVHDLSDLANVPDGVVLVCHSTTPAYVPVLKRVIAVVTEEGGVLSHAAMIAREFKIPTIIGTKTATNKLRDGDLIEVDATNGRIQTLLLEK